MSDQIGHCLGQLAHGSPHLLPAAQRGQRVRLGVGRGLVVGGRVRHVAQPHLSFRHPVGVCFVRRMGRERVHAPPRPRQVRRRRVVPLLRPLDRRQLLPHQLQQPLQFVPHTAHRPAAQLLVRHAAVRVRQHRRAAVRVQLRLPRLQLFQVLVCPFLPRQLPVDRLHVVGQVVNVRRVVPLRHPLRQPQVVVLALLQVVSPRFKIKFPFSPPPLYSSSFFNTWAGTRAANSVPSSTRSSGSNSGLPRVAQL